jgi:hypothetical protein
MSDNFEPLEKFYNHNKYDELDNNNFNNIDDIDDLKILIDKKAELETAINKIDKRILQIKDNFIF